MAKTRAKENIEILGQSTKLTFTFNPKPQESARGGEKDWKPTAPREAKKFEKIVDLSSNLKYLLVKTERR